MSRPMRILILGGTMEARMLAERMAGDHTIAPILSLAGRTIHPTLPAIPYRIGGFGWIAGLIAYLKAKSIDLVIDATHPFAEQMSVHAESACRETGIPLVLFTRPPWTRCDGDRWNQVENAEAAAQMLGAIPRRVFLTVGRLQLPAFAAAPLHHFLIRTIDPPEPSPTLPNYRLMLARGPFSLSDEIRLMATEKIEILVSKNSGGAATYAKIEAARKLGILVILMQPPARAEVPSFHNLDAILGFIHNATHQRPPEPRGV